MAVDSPLTLSRLVANVLGHLALALFLSAILAGCGGGGGGGGSAAPSSGTSGSIVKGPVANSTVRLYSLDSNGAKTLLATTTTNATGGYQFNATPAAGTVLLVEASNGTYIDEITGQPTALSGDFRAVGVANGAAVRISVSPFSEAVVAEIAATSPGNWSAARVQAANAAMSDWLGTENLLEFHPVDFTGPRAQRNAEEASEQDFIMSLQLGGFAGFLNRLGGPGSLAQGVTALRSILRDTSDDRYATDYLLGIVEFINASGFDPDYKRAIKGLLVLDSQYASDAEIDAALPTGRATGSASAPMPDDAFSLVPDINAAPQDPIMTEFNSRGALVAYQLNAGNPDFFRVIDTASVGEVFGDGEVGIGRWHGGFISDVIVENGDTRLVHHQYLRATDGLPYAVAIPATDTPNCGIRTLQFAASTMPVQSAGSGVKPIVGFTQDSRIAVQYLGASAYVGVDIGLLLSNGTVFRVTSSGGLTSPWSSGFLVGPNRTFTMRLTLAGAPGPLQGLEVDANGSLAGTGGRKAAMMFRVRSPAVDAETLAVVFIAPDIPPDASGCATSSVGDGSTVSPPPLDGVYYVFAGRGVLYSTFMGVPKLAAFRPDGALRLAGFDLSAPELVIPPATPVFELAGNTKAAIGRVKGSFILAGSAYDLSLPFAVAEAHADGTYPRSGTRRFRLLSATAPVVVVNANGTPTELTPGRIVGATLDLDFGYWPAGFANDYYGSANLRIDGTVAGADFTISLPFSSTAPSTQYFKDSGTFNGNNETGSFSAALAGNNFEYAVVSYVRGVGNAVVHGALLLEAE